MFHNQPRVGIVVPVYIESAARLHLLEDTISTVLGQDYGNLVCVVVDDGSPDEFI
jgi:glycosyltransferase involved in cell wall biosynthesis